MKRFKLMKGMLACLLSLALMLCAIGPVGAKADPVDPDPSSDPVVGSESGSGTSTSGTSTSGTSTSGQEVAAVTAEYDPATDSIIITGTSAVKVYYADVKKAAGASLKATSFKNVTLAKAEAVSSTSGTETSGSGSGTEESGSGAVTNASTDDAYTATIALDSKANGFSVGEKKDFYLYYTTVEPSAAKTAYTPNLVVKATATTTKLAVTLNYAAAYEGSTVCAIASAKIGAKGAQTDVDLANVIYRVSDETGKKFGAWKPASEFTGAELAADIATVSVTKTKAKINYQFKVKGSAKTASEDAKRASAAAKAKAAKQGNASKAKLDYAKGTLSIKNGFDYAVVTAQSGDSGVPTPTASDWITIKPYNTSGSGETTVAASSYTPVAKYAAGLEASFAKEQIKSLKAVDLLGDAEKVYIYVRKSATAKAPAGKASAEVEVSKPEAAPAFSTSVEVTPATGKKKAKIEIPAAFKDGTYEYLIVKADSDISSAKWTAIKNTTKAIALEIGKAKSKISKNETVTLTDDGTTYILIRKAAVKATKNAPVGKLASEYVWTSIVSETTSTSGSSTSGSSTSGGSTSGESTSGASTAAATTTKVWKAVDAPAGTSSTSGESTQAAKYTITLKAGAPTGVALKAEDGETDLAAAGYEKGTAVKFKVIGTPADNMKFKVVKDEETDELVAEGNVYTVTVGEANIVITVSEVAAV